MNTTTTITAVVLVCATVIAAALILSGAFHHTEACHVIHAGTMQARWVGNCHMHYSNPGGSF